MEDQSKKLLDRRINRRDAIKAGGVAALGLAFAKPVIETIYPKPISIKDTAVFPEYAEQKDFWLETSPAGR